MAAKSLTLNEMAHVTATMMHPESNARARLAATPLLAPLATVLEAAHASVLQAMPSPDDPRLTELGVQAAAVDAMYDTLATGTYDLLTSTSRLVDDGERYLTLRNSLLPDGSAAATQITYEGQAGFAKRLRSRLTEEVRAQLADIAAGPRSLLEVVTEWMDAGDRLGELDLQRQRIAAAAQAPSAETITKARLQWIRAINALRHLAPLAALSADDTAAIFGALDDIEARADQRAARRRASKLEQDVAEELEASAGSAGV